MGRKRETSVLENPDIGFRLHDRDTIDLVAKLQKERSNEPLSVILEEALKIGVPEVYRRTYNLDIDDEIETPSTKKLGKNWDSTKIVLRDMLKKIDWIVTLATSNRGMLQGLYNMTDLNLRGKEITREQFIDLSDLLPENLRMYINQTLKAQEEMSKITMQKAMGTYKPPSDDDWDDEE